MKMNFNKIFLTGSVILSLILSGCSSGSFSEKDSDGNELNNYFECQKLCDVTDELPLSYCNGYTAVLEPAAASLYQSVIMNKDGTETDISAIIPDENFVIQRMIYSGSDVYIQYYTRAKGVKRFIVKADLKTNSVKSVYNVPAGRSVFDFCLSPDGRICYVYGQLLSDESMETNIVILESDMSTEKGIKLSDVIKKDPHDNTYTDTCFFADGSFYFSTYKAENEEYYADALYRLNPECTEAENTELVTGEFGDGICAGYETESGKILLAGKDNKTGDLLLSLFNDSTFKNADKRYNLPDVKGICKGLAGHNLYYIDSEGFKQFNFDDEKSTLIFSPDNGITAYSGFFACGCVNGNDAFISCTTPVDSHQTVSLYDSDIRKNKEYSLQGGKITNVSDIQITDDKSLYVAGYDSDENAYLEIWDEKSNMISCTSLWESDLMSSGYFLHLAGIFDDTAYVIAENDLECYVSEVNGDEAAFTQKDGAYLASFHNSKDPYLICTENEDIYYVNLKTDEKDTIEDLCFSDDISIFDGNKDCDFYYSTAEGVYEYNLSTKSSKCIMNMLDSDFYFHINSWNMENKDNYIVRAYDGINGDTGFYRLKRSSKSVYEVKKNKKQINLAVLGGMSDDIAKSILQFNLENSDSLIVLEDYSKYRNFESTGEITEKFNMDIVSGKIPDIIMGNDSSIFEEYINKDLFTDLSPFIERMNESEYYSGVMNTFRNDKGIPAVVSEFSFNSFTVNNAFTEHSAIYTTDNFEKDADRILKDGKNSIRSDNLIDFLILKNLNSYVDLKNSTCRFDDPEFIKILDDIKKYYSPEVHTAIDDNTDEAAFVKFSSLLQCSYINYSVYKNNCTFAGCPVPEADNWSFTFVPERIFAVSSKCTENETAWKFIKQFLSHENQERTECLPVSRNAMDKQFEHCMFNDNLTWGFANIPAMDDKLADNLKGILDSLNIRSSANSKIADIITNEVNEMLDCNADATEVSVKIQSAVSKYINESK